MQSLPPTESQHSVFALAGVYSSQNPKTHAASPESWARHRICPRHIRVPRKGKFASLGCPSSTQYRGDVQPHRERRPWVTRSISRYRVARAGTPAASKCKLRIFKMRRISFGRTGQSSRRWLGKSWRKAAATSSSPHRDGMLKQPPSLRPWCREMRRAILDCQSPDARWAGPAPDGITSPRHHHAERASVTGEQAVPLAFH
jgi:hypothetical protein